LRLCLLPGLLALLVTACHPPGARDRDLILPELVTKDYTHFYPPEAYDLGLEGKVVLLVRIEVDGSVSEVKIDESSEHAILDEAALDMARILRFSPARLGSSPHALWMKMPVVFRSADRLQTFIDLEEWQQATRDYQSAAARGEARSRRQAQQDLLRHYVHLAHKMVATRAVTPNGIVLELSTPSIHDMWRDYQSIWPLTFVPFQDYRQRYPDSEFVNLAESYLREYLEYESSQLTKALAEGTPEAQIKRQLLITLTQLLTEIKPDNAELD
jgi:protein TonB